MVAIPDISKLTDAQRQILLDRLAKTSATDKNAAHPSPTEALLFNALREAFPHLRFGTFVKGYGRAKFTAEAARFSAFLDRACRNMRELSKVEAQTLADTCIEHLVSATRRWRAARTDAEYIISALDDLERAVDRHYPGYAKSGMLGWVILANTPRVAASA